MDMLLLGKQVRLNDQRPEDLIFLLKHTPTIPNFGRDKNYFNILRNFIEKKYGNWNSDKFQEVSSYW